jgi:hypothetical protein
MRAMMATDEIERAAYLDRISLRDMVQRRIFCEATGAVLDIRTAVVVAIHRDTADGPEAACVVMTAAAYDNGGRERIAQVVASAAERGTVFVPQVIDGRDYTARGLLTAKARAAREAAKTKITS